MGKKGWKQRVKRLGAVSAALVIVALAAPAGHAVDRFDYEFFPTPTAWDPGPGTSRFDAYPNPGGATWSVMPAGMGDASGHATGHGAALTVDLDTMVTPAADGYEASVVQACLDIWAAVCDFTNLGQVADGGGHAGQPGAAGGVGDIRVAGWEIDPGAGGGVLAHAWQPGTEAVMGAGYNILGDVHMDVERVWVDDENDATGNGVYDFFTVMLHELGHALGLGHSDVPGALMNAFYAGGHRWLHADDIAGIQAIYGDAPGPDIPEPASLLLMALGAGAFALVRRKRS